MNHGIPSLRDSGSKLWLDSVDPDHLDHTVKFGVTGATSNPIIVSGLVSSGRFDDRLQKLLSEHEHDEEVAWAMTDWLVAQAQSRFAEVWERTAGNDGWVSFELDPLIDAEDSSLDHDRRIARYIELGRHWSDSAEHPNRMIKVPASPAGIGALEELAASGVTLNVTLVFTERQYTEARDAIWRGAQRRAEGLDGFKSVYSIFVSRVDVYTEKHVPELSGNAQGQVGIANAKQIYNLNRAFWRGKDLKLEQEMIFASTGTKKPEDPKDKYVMALAGDGILTNPPETYEFLEQSQESYCPWLKEPIPADLGREIREKVDFAQLESVLMDEGLKKFADPHRELVKAIGQKRRELAPA